jgi:hypothetical protein
VEAGSKLSLPKVKLNDIQDDANLSMFIKFCIAVKRLSLYRKTNCSLEN